MDDKTHKQLKTRINRIGGQVAGIGRMIDEDKYCVEILHQIAAVRAALDSLGIQMLHSHLESCVLGHGTETAHEATAPMTQEQLLAELRAALTNFLK